MGNLGPNFYSKLIQISSDLGMKPEDLLAIMVSESGLDPSSKSDKFKGSGLIGFMSGTLNNIGFKGDYNDFAQLSGQDQLDYVKKVVQGDMRINGGPFTSAAQYYVANLFPVALNLPGVKSGDPNTKILELNPQTSEEGYSQKYLDIGSHIKGTFESLAYKSNPLFDKEKKGFITFGDLMRQVEINKQNPIYQNAIQNLKAAQNNTITDNSINNQSNNQYNNISFDNLDNILEDYLQQVNSSYNKLYKHLPLHYGVIKISSIHPENSIEFARVLSSVIETELNAKSFTHLDEKNIELEFSINGPEKESYGAINQITQATVQVFKKATLKIGGIAIKTKLIPHKKSFREPIDIKTAQLNRRKFLLKFMRDHGHK